MVSPKTRNALSLDMLNELQSNLSSLPDSVRCIVLRGEGPAFSSGHNLKELTSAQGRQYHQRVFDTCSRLMLSLAEMEVPVIAQVDGVAAAAGCQLVASCDIVLATRRSQFSTPGGGVGLFCSTPGVAVARAVPRRVASHLLLTGLTIDGERALRVGLVSVLCAPEELQTETARVTAAIAAKSRAVIALGKRFFQRQLEMTAAEAYSEGGRVMVDNIALCDGQEGIRGFVEKRPPVWRHTDEKAHD